MNRISGAATLRSRLSRLSSRPIRLLAKSICGGGELGLCVLPDSNFENKATFALLCTGRHILLPCTIINLPMPRKNILARLFSPALRRLGLGAVLFVCGFASARAQIARPAYTVPNIRTLRLCVDGNADHLPVLQKGQNETLTVSFDDMTHEYRRYTYRIEHCDTEGNPSDELFESDYVRATADEVVIDDYETSQNTTQLYTHYSFSLPNSQMRPLLSGNYCIVVSTENEDGDPVEAIRTYFAIVDTKVSISPTCSTDTEVDWNNAHQQLSLRIDMNNLTLREARTEVRTVVMQNRRLDNAKVNVPYTSQNGKVLIWDHSRNLVFTAGNEYRKMEILSTRYPGMHGEGVSWVPPYYHYTLFTDYPRKNYLYDEDRNGLSVVRWEGNGDADTEADYVITHFRLETLPLPEGERLYVAGQWANTGFAPEYEMTYNHDEGAYTADVLMKCGYYNYMYLRTTTSAPTVGSTQPAEGDFYQTENEYDILVYYRPTGTRYWQLVGCVTPKYRKQ